MTRSRKGFTLIEILIFSGIAVFAVFCVAQLLMKTFMAQNLAMAAETPTEARRAMERLVGDLKEAVPDSLRWEVMTSTMPLIITKPRINPVNGQYEAIPVGYGYEGPAKGQGALVRVEGSSTTIILSPIDPPSPMSPIFNYDRSLRLVMIDIHYNPPGHTPVRVVRRVALAQ